MTNYNFQFKPEFVALLSWVEDMLQLQPEIYSDSEIYNIIVQDMLKLQPGIYSGF